jgi:hypothetical protein
VHATPPEDVPREWAPTLRLLHQLEEIFPDQIIDVAEVTYTPDSQED